MLFFDHARRGDFHPRSLIEGKVAELKRDIQGYLSRDALESAQTDVPNVWKYPLEPDVTSGLMELTNGRCAFCEQMVSRLSPYRFRPPAHALSDGGATTKSCYLWLAFHWENLFPICDECTPSRKNYFPVIGKRAEVPEFSQEFDAFQGPALDLDEDPVLYYPGERRITQAFQIRLDGRLIGSRRANPTIAHFSLNRPALVEERRHFLTQLIKELLARPSSDHSYPSLQSSAPYPSAAYLLTSRIGREIRRQTKRKLNLAPSAIGSAIARLWRDGDAYPIIFSAIEEVRRQDENRGLPHPVAIEEKLPKPEVDLNQPRIKHVHIQNFKSLESIDFSMKAQMPEVAVAMSVPNEFTDVPDAPCLLILGENATGKSSILEAIALTCIPTDLRNQLQESPADLLLDPEYMGSAGHDPIDRGSIEVEFHNDAPTLKLVLDRSNGIFSDASAAHHPLVFAYGAHRLFDKEQRDDVVRHIDTLFRRDQVISNPEPWLIGLSKRSPQSLNEVVSALRHIIQIDGHFRNIEVGRDQQGREYCAINIERKNPDGLLRQRLSVVSSGYRAVLAVVCDIFSRLLELSNYDPRAARHARAIILIDEIEAHLHPRWKMQIVSGLRRALPRSTFILTSHDPLCLRGMFAGEVMMLNRYRNRDQRADSNMNEVVEQISDFANIENLTIDQLLTSDIFQLFSTDDRRIETTFAEVPAILKKEEEFLRTREERWRLSEREQTILRAFRDEISNGLPYGKTEVSRLVQEAVAEYVASRRVRDKSSNEEKRERAKTAVKSYLGDLLG